MCRDNLIDEINHVDFLLSSTNLAVIMLLGFLEARLPQFDDE